MDVWVFMYLSELESDDTALIEIFNLICGVFKLSFTN